jgi:glycosyltransferase involved in cell wall biosynthesis/GT2 family glycosyltransferase
VTPRRRLRTTLISPTGVVGGGERMLLQMLAVTNRLEVEAVLLGDGPFRQELARLGIPSLVLPTGAGRSLRELAATVGHLSRRLRRSDTEVVLANGVKAAAVGVPASLLSGVPIVWAKNDLSYDRTLARPLGAVCQAVIAPGVHAATATGRSDAVIIPPPLPSWVPVGRRESRAFWAARDAVHEHRLTLAMLCRLVPYKAVDDAIRALLDPAAAAWDLAVVGEDDPSALGEHRRLDALARALGVRHRVHFTGAIQDAARWISGFDAVAVITRRDARGFGAEGFALAALEALYGGVPLLGGESLPEVARLARAGGLTVPVGVPAALAAALQRLDDAALRRELGARGRALLAAHPDARHCADRMASTLAAAATRPAAGTGGGPALSVVTTVLDEGAAADGLVSRLRRQLAEGDELVVVDGGSRDDTVERAATHARKDPRVAVLQAPGAGISAGRNVAVRAATHRVIASTDAGCEPADTWLDAIRGAFVGSDTDLVTGVYRVTERTAFESAMAAACYPDPREARRRTPLTRLSALLFGRAFDATMPTGRSMAFTREAWDRVGGFPEDLRTAEDVSFGRAIAASGGRCVLSTDALVTWAHRPTLGATARMYARYGAGSAHSGDARLIARDLLRAGVYAAAPLAAWRGGARLRGTLGFAGAVYLAVPAGRVLRGSHGAGRTAWILALLPVAAAVKDVAKAVGCIGAGLPRISASGPGSSSTPGETRGSACAR